jgi:hypothetical protein
LENWVQIFSSDNFQESTMLMVWLKSFGIEVFLFNQKDSVYPTFGEIHLLVHPDQKERALELIQNHGYSS